VQTRIENETVICSAADVSVDSVAASQFLQTFSDGVDPKTPPSKSVLFSVSDQRIDQTCPVAVESWNRQ
jgi:hypothetical protein